MDHIDRRNALRAVASAAGLTALSHSAAPAAEPRQPKTDGPNKSGIKIPESLKAEHEELHEELVQATKAGGKSADAAKAVAKLLHAHFVKEEELAMPPLGFLRALADGPVQPEMAKVVEMTDKLKRELPTMLKEHEAILGALQTLVDAAKQENKPQVRQFAEKLKQHARTEEEVMYPAAILVGEYVKLKLNK